MNRIFSIVVVALCSTLSLGSAMGTPLNLATGLSRSLEPGTSALIDIAATNAIPGEITDFNAFLLAFQLLPQPGATGTLTITAAGQPATNAILSDPEVILNPSGSVAPSAVNGSSGFVGAILANNDPDIGDVLAAGATANLVTLTLSASAGASGTWTLFAITNDSPISAWQSTASADDIAFGNLPIPAAGSFSSLQLGTVSVAPVPEPDDTVFPAALVLVAVLAGGRAVRGRVRAGANIRRFFWMPHIS